MAHSVDDVNADDASGALDRVYSATSETELTAAYAAWANGYDRETAALGYCLPFLIAGWIARHVAKGDGPILDAGCGTGLSAPFLAALGYDRLEGLDVSAEMLGIAAARGVYAGLQQAALGGPLPWPNRHFAAWFSTGVFTVAHAPASSLDELVRITRRGGRAVFTVRDQVLDDFRAKFAELEHAGRWHAIEESPPFRVFAVAEPDVLVQAFVFEIS